MSLRLPRLLKHNRRGQGLVEFALILPLLVLFVLIAIDFGRIYFSYVQISNAAREAANYGSLNPTDWDGTQNNGIYTAAARETNVQSQNGEQVGGFTIPQPVCKNPAGTVIACSGSTSGGGSGNTITVTVVEQFSFLTPLVNNFFSNNFKMSTSATSTVLGYVASAGATPPPSCSAPLAAFTVNVTSGTTVFADPSASTPTNPPCAISGYNWTWGDGNDDVGTATGDSYAYANAGTYTITLEVTNQGGSSTVSHQVTVPAGPPPPTCAKPHANFSWTSSGKSRTYQDTSTVADPVNCPITDWLWTFTDLGGTHSNSPNPPTQTYGNNSAHPVTLQVTNAGGTDSITQNT